MAWFQAASTFVSANHLERLICGQAPRGLPRHYGAPMTAQSKIGRRTFSRAITMQTTGSPSMQTRSVFETALPRSPVGYFELCKSGPARPNSLDGFCECERETSTIPSTTRLKDSNNLAAPSTWSAWPVPSSAKRARTTVEESSHLKAVLRSRCI
jgi:hypothetical protein